MKIHHRWFQPSAVRLERINVSCEDKNDDLCFSVEMGERSCVHVFVQLMVISMLLRQHMA